MFENKSKKQPMVFRPTPKESEAIRFIADVYQISISEVIRQLINHTNHLESLALLALMKLANDENITEEVKEQPNENTESKNFKNEKNNSRK